MLGFVQVDIKGNFPKDLLHYINKSDIADMNIYVKKKNLK